jgi:hypothetical protein
MAMVASMVAVVTAGTGIAGYIAAGILAVIGAGRTRGIATSGGSLHHALKAPTLQTVLKLRVSVISGQ